MKTRILFDQGSAKFPEDSFIFVPPRFFGVADGISGAYLPQEGPKIFEGERTGGQFATHIIRLAFETASPGDNLGLILERANGMLKENISPHGLSIRKSETLPSATFAIAEVGDELIRVIQVGDSLAVWRRKNGKMGGTHNWSFEFENELRGIVAGLMEKAKGDRQEMWRMYRPLQVEKRRQTINVPGKNFVLLNGQPDAERLWHDFNLLRREISLLILFTDGLVPFGWTHDSAGMAEKVISLYEKGGLAEVLNHTRALADQEKSTSHEDYAEATALAIEF